MSKKEHDERLVKELQLMKKTKSYFEMYDLMNLYDRLVKVFSNFKDDIKIIELNEDPFIKEEKFPINLSSFILYINNFEYLLFIEIEELSKFKKSDLELYFSLFTNYYNKKGFFIVWNDKDLSTFYVDYVDIYVPINKVYERIKINLESLDKALKNRIKKVPKKKFRIENINKMDLDIRRNLENRIKDKFEEELDSIKLRMQKTSQKFNEKEIINSLILLFDDFFESKITNEELKTKILKLYNYIL